VTGFFRSCSEAVLPAKVSIAPGAFVQGIPECEESRMPIGDAVCVKPVIGTVIAETVKETPLHSGSLRICMDVSKGVQRTPNHDGGRQAALARACGDGSIQREGIAPSTGCLRICCVNMGLGPPSNH